MSITCYVYREKVEFVSKFVQGKMAIRAVLLNDMKLLQSLVDDHNHVYEVGDGCGITYIRGHDVLLNLKVYHFVGT